MAAFVAVLGFSLISPILPVYIVDLGASYKLLGVTVAVYGAVQLLTQIPCGKLSDRIGRKKLILAGMLIFALLAPLYVRAENAYWIILLRIFGGLGSSMVWPIAMAMVIDKASVSRRGWAMGWYNAALYSAFAVGPAIGGGLYDFMGLGAPFYFWSALSLISLLIVFYMVEEPQNIASPSRHERSGESTGCSISRSILSKNTSLIQDGYLLAFAACCTVVVWTGLIAGFNMTLLPNYANQLKFSSTEIGLLYFAFAGTTALSNVYFGKRSDRGGRKAMIFVGTILGALSFLLLTLANSSVVLMMVMAVLGFSLGMETPASSAIVADISNPERRGEIFGIFNTARILGMVIGPLIAGVSADAYGIEGSLSIFMFIGIVVTLGTLMVRDPGRTKTESDMIP